MRRGIGLVLGSLLLIAAGLKVFGGDAGAPSGWWADPRLKLATVLWELVLGCWLLAGVRTGAAWLATVGTFGTFAVVSGYLGVRGVPSCGCLGAAQASPWWAFGIDLAALILLTSFPPRRNELVVSRQDIAWRSLVMPGTAAVLVAGAAAVAVGAQYGSTEAALADLRGDTVVPRTVGIDLGSGRPGEWKDGVAEIANWTPTPVRVFGGTTGCDYDILADCPREIGPKEVGRFRVRLKGGDRPGRAVRPATFWLTDGTGSVRPVTVVLSLTVESAERDTR